jgi:hypothetical protein
LFGLTALSTKQNPTFTIPADAASSLKVALILFGVAALLALFTNVPLEYEEAKAQSLRHLVKTGWQDPKPEAEAEVAKAQVRTLAKAKKNNALKAYALGAALLLEVFAVGAVALAIWIIL